MTVFEEFPQSICIRLNRRCNLACSFCLANRETAELSTEQIKRALDILKGKGLKKACLAGGEPSLREDLTEIVAYCASVGLRPVIYTNLTDVDHLMAELPKYPVSVTTSIHGNREFHDSVTRPGAYETTFANIRRLIALNIPVAIHMVIMRENACHAEELIQKAAEDGVSKITFQTLIPRGKGAEFFERGEREENIVQTLESLYPLREKYKNRINVKFLNFYDKDYYVLETDGCLYIQRECEGRDVFLTRIVD